MMKVVRKSRVGLMLADSSSFSAFEQLLPAVDRHQRHVFEWNYRSRVWQRNGLPARTVLADKNAELFHPRVAVSNVVPAGGIVWRRRQLARRTAFRRQLDSADNPNPVPGRECLSNFLQDIFDRMIRDHFLAEQVVTMHAKIGNRRKRDLRSRSVIVAVERNRVLPRREHDQVGWFRFAGDFFGDDVDVCLAFVNSWPRIDWQDD